MVSLRIKEKSISRLIGDWLTISERGGHADSKMVRHDPFGQEMAEQELRKVVRS